MYKRQVLFWNLDTNVKYFYFVWTVAVLLCLLSMRIAHSKWGREFKAVKDNAEAIESLGLDIKKIKIRAFTPVSYTHLTQVERIFPPDKKTDKEIMEGTGRELAQAMAAVLRKHKFI